MPNCPGPGDPVTWRPYCGRPNDPRAPLPRDDLMIRYTEKGFDLCLEYAEDNLILRGVGYGTISEFIPFKISIAPIEKAILEPGIWVKME